MEEISLTNALKSSSADGGGEKTATCLVEETTVDELEQTKSLSLHSDACPLVIAMMIDKLRSMTVNFIFIFIPLFLIKLLIGNYK